LTLVFSIGLMCVLKWGYFGLLELDVLDSVLIQKEPNMTITFLTDAADHTFEEGYRKIHTCVNSRHGYLGIDLEDRAGGHKESITLSIQEMEKIIEFYRKNVEVK